MTENSPTTRRVALEKLAALLRYQQSCGIERYGDAERIRDAFARLRSQLAKPAVNETLVSSAPSAPAEASEAPAVTPAVQTIAELASIIRGCTDCELHRRRIYDTAGSTTTEPRLLIVGGWLDGVSAESPRYLFGAAEDEMVKRMLAAISLSPDEVFITNLIKCAVAGKNVPTDAQTLSCFDHLKNQIEILAPRCMLAMGTRAAHLLCGSSQPLSGLRGRVHFYTAASGRRIEVLATYHPSFLLANSEMKAATWSDLQVLQKRLNR
jgi:uracil-DNA glycosylase family 4